MKKFKLFFRTLAGLAVIGALLITVVGALADTQDFSLVGLLAEDAGVYSVKGVEFDLSEEVCTAGEGNPACVDLVGQLVEVVGTYEDTVEPYVLVATSITEVDPATEFTYVGVLESAGTESWTIGEYDFWLISADPGPGTILPEFYAEGDTVEVTFTVDEEGEYWAKGIIVLDSGEGNTYTFEGELKAINGSMWTVEEHDFNVEGISLPPYFGLGDIVEVTFSIQDGEFVVTAVEVTVTNVPAKVESSRCENGRPDHPIFKKVADSVGEPNPQVIYDLFCKGFGLGEIKLAYKHAQDSAYTPAMLLALRAEGRGWGEIKKMAADTPFVDDSESEESTTDTKVKPDKPEKPDKPGKPETTGKPDKDDKTNNGKAKGKDK